MQHQAMRQNNTKQNQMVETKERLQDYARQLARILRTPGNEEAMRRFLDDFLTPAEIKHLVERYLIGDLILRGVPQRNVKQTLRVSISKVSRTSNMLQHGLGAFREVWTALQPKRAGSRTKSSVKSNA